MDIDELKKTIDEKTPFFQARLAEMIEIPSVKGPAKSHAPFGQGPRAALNQALMIAQSLGLTTKQLNDQVGWAELTGKDESYIAALGHLDVVAAQQAGWKSDPFKLTLKGDYMYGRGVLDNKGPIMGALFALALLKKAGFHPRHSIRIIFGTDEESGSADMQTYNLVEKPSIAGFTPDGKYPVVFAERGMLRLSLRFSFQDQSDADLAAIMGDFSPSYLPDKAVIQFTSGVNLTYLGEKTPSNAPDLGKNALASLAEAQRFLPGQLGAAFNWLYLAATDSTGNKLEIAFNGKTSGKLQISVYGVEYFQASNQLQVNFSIRYPIELSKAQLLQNLQAHLPANSKLIIKTAIAPLYRDPQMPMIKQMQAIYERVTGLDGTPVTTTGITYARFLPNIVAFGPSFPGQRGIAHKENEWLKVSDWQKIILIEYLTLKSLATMDFN
ncbi:hypothetical protein FC89_GL002426 [Liquorilactobacillus ghanensis DSM 18630]|uniref:Peptidase M20 n=1 Tax=Liquorilactobacillus ghanensis DSM 18630 TaxID=1423750 RepID=A0A0R1VF06_9LACO|nr:M20/M25/M40 family metallo-hydrolase [Liquorilactobacillus ghanensis]KRM04023.1 hypothetical protein FC89_GL002426 [Liquorilactobacillus ghanensis DSM 18630]